jgi:hypothetical protein
LADADRLFGRAIPAVIGHLDHEGK